MFNGFNNFEGSNVNSEAFERIFLIPKDSFFLRSHGSKLPRVVAAWTRTLEGEEWSG